MKIADYLLRDRKIRGNDALVDTYIICHCGAASKHSADWQVVQNWWRAHGYGRACIGDILSRKLKPGRIGPIMEAIHDDPEKALAVEKAFDWSGTA